MPWVDIPLAKKSYQPRSGTASIERLVNLYAEANEEGAKTPFTLYGDAGLIAWQSVGSGPIRGLHSAMGYVWAVSGNSLYAINETTKVATLIGDSGVINGKLPVRMIDNGTQVVIVAQPVSYMATLSGVTALTIADLSSATFQDGYGIYVQRGTQNIYISNLDNLGVISALDFTTADAKPDNAVACVSSQREVWALKEKTIEIYANSGATFPFSRIAYVERGILSPGSLALADGSLFWLGDDKRVYRSSGYQPVPISGPAIERMIASAYSPQTAEAFAYTQAGHTFYVLTFADLTLKYDVSTGLWGERRSYGLNRWRATCHTRVGADTNLVGDYSTGDIYQLDMDTYAENGEIIERIIVEPPLSDDPDPIFVHELFFDIEAGVGLTSGQGVAPIAMLSSSDDDGNTWSNDRELSIGALGKRRQRVNFTRLGRSLNRSFRLRITDPVKIAIHGSRARVEAGVR